MPNGTSRTPWQPQLFPWIGREESFERERGVDPDVRLWDACVLTFWSAVCPETRVSAESG